MSNEIILGFDAREMWLAVDEQWTDDRRSKFLYKADVPKPLSTDVMVWDSIFRVRPTTALPDWIGPIQDLWDELPRMAEALQPYVANASEPFWTIAVTLVMDHITVADRAAWPEFATIPTIPSEICEAWMLLGYDVSDRYLLSGLSNCGYVSEKLRAVWHDKLNVFHLFIDPEAAAEFKQATDKEVPEHAPFFVYGIYLMQQYPHVDVESPIEVWRSLDQSLEPAREAFRAAHQNMTEDEVMDMINDIVHEVRRERPHDGKPDNQSGDL